MSLETSFFLSSSLIFLGCFKLTLFSCVENNHLASFEKFYPQLPNEQDLPFYLSSQKNVDNSFQWLMDLSLE